MVNAFLISSIICNKAKFFGFKMGPMNNNHLILEGILVGKKADCINQKSFRASISDKVKRKVMTKRMVTFWFCFIYR